MIDLDEIRYWLNSIGESTAALSSFTRDDEKQDELLRHANIKRLASIYRELWELETTVNDAK